jgi:type IV pilus assembly protein PilN
MITINLLPKDRRRGRGVSLSRPVLIGVLGVVIVAAGLVWYWTHLDGQIQSLQQQVEQSQEELKRYEGEIKRVDQFRADKKRLEERLQVVAKLTAEQEGPVRLLDAVSRILPDEVWLTGMNKTKDRLVLQGFAFSNFGIASFMTELGKLQRPAVRNVELTFSEQATVERVPVERFEVTASLGG